MTWDNLAIEIPVVVAFALFALQLVKLNNKQTDGFILMLSKLQETFLVQLDGQAKIFDSRNDALIAALRVLQEANKVNNLALAQSLRTLAKQEEFTASLLIKHDIRMNSYWTSFLKTLNVSNPVEVPNSYQEMLITPRKIRNHHAEKPDPTN
jgi:hypothetical protein